MTMQRLLSSSLASLTLALAGGAAGAATSAAQPAPEANAAAADRFQVVAAELQAAREQMSAKAAQNELSQTLAAALKACDEALKQQDAAAARRALAPLEAYASLMNFPSIEVQMFAGRISALEHNQEDAMAHAARVASLLQRYHQVDGTSAATPMEFWNQFELREWVGVAELRLQSVKALTGSSELRGEFLDKNGQPQVRYLQPRMRPAQAYAPIDDSRLNEEQRQVVADARKLTDAFLDSKVPYLRLRQAIDQAARDADPLIAAHQCPQALARLEQLSEIYPVDRIPYIPLLSRISLCAGETGDLSRQQVLRARMFGLQQVIARSGTGESAASAITVAFVTDEYLWLQSHGLKVLSQQLLPGEKIGQPGKSFDAFEVEGPQGKHTVYFDITRMFRLYANRDPQ